MEFIEPLPRRIIEIACDLQSGVGLEKRHGLFGRTIDFSINGAPVISQIG